LLEVADLDAGYGRLQIISGLKVTAKEGEITVVVGPNGSGKSTLLKSIFGLADVMSGTIRFNGTELTGLPTYEIARRGVAYLPQLDNIFSNLTVKENLVMAGYTVDNSEFGKRVAEVQEMFPFLREYARRKAGTLSGGERQMLAMAMALLRQPRLIMFDEPTGNLAPKIAMQVLNKIIEFRERLGIAIILVEQSAKRALEVGQRCYLLVGGRSVFSGEPKDLLSHPELSKLYLGIKVEATRLTPSAG